MGSLAALDMEGPINLSEHLLNISTGTLLIYLIPSSPGSRTCLDQFYFVLGNLISSPPPSALLPT